MARFVQLPSGTVFAQKPLQFGTPLQGSNLTTKDVVDILNVAEAVGKSESIGAVAGKLKEGISTDYNKLKDWWNKPAEGAGVAGQETAPTAESQAASEMRDAEGMQRAERRDFDGSMFNKSAVSKPLDTSGTGSVMPPPKETPVGQVPDKSAPQKPPVAPEIPPANIAPILPAIKPVVTEAEKAQDKRYSDSDLDRYARMDVTPPAIGPNGAADPADLERYNKEVEVKKQQIIAQGQAAEQAKAAQAAQAAQVQVPQVAAAPVKAAPTIDEAAKARAAAAAAAQAAPQQVQIKQAPPEVTKQEVVITPDVYKNATQLRDKISEVAVMGSPKDVATYVQSIISGGKLSTDKDYYQLLGILKSAKEQLPSDDKDNRWKVYQLEENLRRSLREKLGDKFEEVPVKLEPKKSSQSDMLYEQALSKFMEQGTDALTDAEKFYLAGGPPEAKAPQPPQGKKVIGAGGVEVKQEKGTGLQQKALEGRRPETTVPPAGGTAGAGAGVPAGRSAKEAVIAAPSAAVPQIEAAKAGIAQPAFDVDAKILREAAAKAGGAAGEKAAEQVARTEAQPAADFNKQYEKILGQIESAPMPPAPAGTKAVTERALLAAGDPESILKMVEAKIKADEEANVIKIPEKITYQQLLALARKATTPANQQAVLSAFERATNKPPPKTLVEMYSGDNEIRAMAMLEAAFPTKAQEPDAFTKQQKYAAAYKSVADAIKGVQSAEESQAREAAQTQKAYREESEIAAGDVTAQVANKLAKARLYVEQAGDAAEKARRTRELVELEKAGIAATVAAKVAKADRDMLIKVKLAQAGGGAGGKKGEKITPALEWGIKKDSFSRSIADQQAIVANIKNQVTRRAFLERSLPALKQARQAALNNSALAPNIGGYDIRISEMEGELASLPTAQELRNQLILEQNALTGLQDRFDNLGDELIGRKAAVPPAKTSVPLIQGSQGEGQGPAARGETGKAPTTPAKGK